MKHYKFIIHTNYITKEKFLRLKNAIQEMLEADTQFDIDKVSVIDCEKEKEDLQKIQKSLAY